MSALGLRAAAVAGVVLMLPACAGAAATSPVIPPELLSQARAQGRARAIVEVRVPMGADSATVESIKHRVFTHIARTPHRVLRELPNFPLFVLEASEATLAELATSPDVLRVSAESIDRPQR